eukprot:6205390-Pleurochrysis_carterae.AAC.3
MRLPSFLCVCGTPAQRMMWRQRARAESKVAAAHDRALGVTFHAMPGGEGASVIQRPSWQELRISYWTATRPPGARFGLIVLTMNATWSGCSAYTCKRHGSQSWGIGQGVGVSKCARAEAVMRACCEPAAERAESGNAPHGPAKGIKRATAAVAELRPRGGGERLGWET